MPDYSGLLQALAGEQQSYAQQNPWIIGGQAVLKTPVYATNETDPLQTALVQALQGLVGGFATSYGQGQVKTQSDALMGKLQTALAGAAQGGSLGEALLADPDTKVLGETAYLEEQIRKAEDARKQKEFENQLILKGQYDAPTSVDAGGKDFLYQGDPTTGKQVKIGEFDKPTYGYGSVRYQITDPALIAANKAVLKEMYPQMTSEQLESVASDRDLFSKYGIEGRSQRGVDVKEKQSSLFGYEPIGDAPLLGAEEAKALRVKVAAVNNLKSKFDELMSKDINSLSGEDSAVLQGYSGLMDIAFRNLQNTGANLTENEKAINDKIKPKMAAGDFIGAIKAGALGRDQKQYMQDLKKMLQDGIDIEVFSEAGLKRKSKDLGSYPKSLLETFGVTPPSGLTSSAPPARLPGETIADYRARTGL